LSTKTGPGFHHVAFKAYDFDKSVLFYREAFGYEVAYTWGEAPNRAAMIDIGSGDYIEVFSGGAPLEDRSQGVLIHFALRFEDANAAFARAVSAGAVVNMEPKDVILRGEPPVNIRIAFVNGPDGETIEIFQNDVL
jgi:glyoxylase I family protein